MNARDLARLQEQQNLQSTLRSGKTGTRLLDDAENNIGNAIQLNPEMLPPGQLYTVIPQSGANNGRILNLTSGSKTGQSITVIVTAAKIPSQSGLTGPYTGIAEFGNGVVSTRVEFDVPFGPFHSADVNGTAPNDQPQDSGAIIQLPTGILRLFARYDNAFITPELGGHAFGGVGSPVPIAALSGPFAPNQNPVPLTTKAFATYFGRIHTKLYKTQYVYCGNGSLPVTFGYVIGPQLFTANYCVPPFAKSVRVVRQPQSAAMSVQVIDPCAFDPINNVAETDAIYNIPSGVAPVIPLEGNETVLAISSASQGNADKVYSVKLIYEIAF